MQQVPENIQREQQHAPPLAQLHRDAKGLLCSLVAFGAYQAGSVLVPGIISLC
jgi:hypothetical protein